MDTETTIQDTITGKSRGQRKETLSKDGKWKSFPKVRHLLQYVSTGTYFARVRVNGNLKRESLGTDVFTTAELKLADFIKREKGQKLPRFVHDFKDARLKYESDLEKSELAETSKRYRRFCLRALATSWPELDGTPANKITDDHCKAWADKFKGEKDAQYFNNILGTLRGILKIAGRVGADDPTREIKRRGVHREIVEMPSQADFKKLLKSIETSKTNTAKHCADLVRFLAFSGCRLSEAKKVKWDDVDLKGGWITVENAKRRRAHDSSNQTKYRSVPIIKEMEALLKRMRLENVTGAVCRVHECEATLTRACAKVEIPRLTHHDLRHYFGTACAEAGIDATTFSQWMGHSDGGVLAMKLYCHPRKEHSERMAAKVSFGTGGAK